MNEDHKLDIYYFEGTVVFNNLTKPNKFNKYDLTIAIDDANLDIYNQSGIQSKPKYDEKYKQTTVTFGKPAEKQVGKIITAVEPPKVMDGNQDDMDATLVDRGSKVICKVIVYETPKGVGSRLSSVMVVELKKKPEVHNATSYAPF